MTSYQRARERLGLRLRELRRDGRLTGRQLAEPHGWHPTKIYKIENGRQTPGEADIEAWAATCGATDKTDELIAALRSLDSQYVEYRRLLRAGLTSRQLSFGELEAASEVIRCFENVFVPGLLQTSEYARHRLAEGVTYDQAPDDIDEAVAARMQRQQVLYRPGKKFHFVVAESALRVRLCPLDVLAGQLDRLVTLAMIPTIRFGVIPFEAQYPLAPVHGFWIFDDRHVIAENLTAELNVTQPSEVQAYLRAFGELADLAQYGTEARRIIERCVNHLLRSDT